DARPLDLDAFLAQKAGVRVVTEKPFPVVARLGEIRAGNALEPPCIGDVEDIDAAESELAELALQAPDAVAALEPGRLTGFVDVLAERAHPHLARVRAERR